MVRRIFAWVGHERLTLAAVCRRLHAASIPSPSGNAHWSRAMIHTMLLNPAYAGRAIYGRRRCVPWQAPLHPPRGHGGLPRRPVRQIPAAAEQHLGVPVPAIIDEALFASAAERLEANRKRNRERLAGVRYRLRGLLVCQKRGYGFTGHHHRGQWRYYRCCGTDRSRFHGQLRCEARLVAVEPLDQAVWAEVCRLLEDPARVPEEHQRRLDAVPANPRRLELDVLERQIAKARRAIDRLIDGYAEGLIEKPEFEPRMAELRSRVARLEAEAGALQVAEEQARSLQLVIGKLGLFAEMVRDRLEAADWPTMRDSIGTLVKRIEVADDVVRVVFRVEPGSSGPPQPLRRLPHCPTRPRELAGDRDHRPLVADPGPQALAPPLQRRVRPRPGQDLAGGLVEVGAQQPVAAPGDPAGDVDLAGLVARGGQPDPGADRVAIAELARALDRGDVGDRRHAADAGCGHQQPAARVTPGDGPHQPVEPGDLGADRAPGVEQRRQDRGAVGPVGQVLAHGGLEPPAAPLAEHEPEGAERAAQLVGEVELGAHEAAARPDERADLHRVPALHPHLAEEAGAQQLRRICCVGRL